MIILLKNKKSSKHEIIKDIVGYIRLEWLIALSIKINYSEINIKPNLKTDDEGIPYHQAPPKKFDIEIENERESERVSEGEGEGEGEGERERQRERE